MSPFHRIEIGCSNVLYLYDMSHPNPVHSQVSEKEACTLASAFWEEVNMLPGSEHIQSAAFFSLTSRLAKTKHENLLTSNLPKFGLTAGIPMKHVDVGLPSPHPILKISDFIDTLNKKSKLDIILMGNRAPQFCAFWNKWKELQPEHHIFRSSPEKLNWTVPVLVHCDEGTSQKKKSLMIVQYQAMLGRGSRKRKAGDDGSGINLIGNSITTRHLYSVMLGRLYSLEKNQNRPLLRLMGCLGQELQDAFEHGFPCRIDGKEQHLFLAALGMKGDWPALSKVAALTRHHGRDTQSRDDGPGICHLCLGGQKGHSWYDVSLNNMKKMRVGVTLPWRVEPTLIRPLMLKDKYKAEFFKFDLFHCCHKGLMADICANIVVSQFGVIKSIHVVFLFCFVVSLL